MEGRELLKVPNPILRKKCEPVKNPEDVRELVEDMKEFMYSHRSDELAPIGLSAPQLGELLRVFIFYPNHLYREMNGIGELINPELVYARDFKDLRETCLSLPEKSFIISRATRVKVRGFTVEGVTRTYKAWGLFAQVLQHELNHLDGVLVDTIAKG